MNFFLKYSAGIFIGFISINIFCGKLPAQSFFFSIDPSPEVIVSGKLLANPWAGGMNSAQFSTMDLDGDQTDDLVYFDKTASRLFCFLATRQSNSLSYRYAPEYSFLFPRFTGWLLLRDYDQDGKKDIFAHTSFGIQVHRQINAAGQPFGWDVVANPVETQGFNGMINLQVNVIDVPAIVDLDNDGDLDIIVFDFVQGSFLEYHQNQSIEKYQHRAALEFTRITNCWGGVFEGQDCGDFSYGLECGSNRGQAGGGGNPEDRILHVGSTLTILDLNGDQKKDILVGDVSCPQIFQMFNVGTVANAKFEEHSAHFPPHKPIHLSIFPAVYSEDVTGNGLNDLLVTPNVYTSEANTVNFYQSAWLYENRGTDENPDFYFLESDFLQNTMIDRGENAYPTLVDDDGDGDLDLWIGHKGKNEGQKYYASLCRMENTGNTNTPRFEQRSEDVLQLSEQNLTELKPSFADLNNDQAPDLIFTAARAGQTKLYFILNQAALGQPLSFDPQKLDSLRIPVGSRDTPLFLDIDQDGDLDLLLGRGAGNLSYYENTGTATIPQFTLQNDTLGGIKANSLKRNLSLAVADFNQNGQSDLITGDAGGNLRVYADFANHLSATWIPQDSILWDAFHQQYTSFHFGATTTPVGGDINGDGYPDLVLGLNTGGLMYLRNNLGEGPTATEPEALKGIRIYPNPTEKQVYIQSPVVARVEVYDAQGRKLLRQEMIPAGRELVIPMEGLEGGTYLFILSTPDGHKITRRIVFEP
ncbi:MAG: T9SS type A sorting domain-containing protein [Bacteroidia bacterium]|nr:T9SS type A sorting domain-containing protein [Bacteroidia bacterium]